MLKRSSTLELVPSRHVHRVLRPTIESALLPMGFARTGPTPPEVFPRPKGWWLKVAEERFAVVWLMLDKKYGFSRHWGGTFTLNFELSQVPLALGRVLPKPDRPLEWGSLPDQPLEYDKRWWKLLDGQQRKKAMVIQRRVLAALPGSPESQGKILQKWFVTGQYPWEDVWARYATLEDVHSWADFLKETLPSTTSRFLREARSRTK